MVNTLGYKADAFHWHPDVLPVVAKMRPSVVSTAEALNVCACVEPVELFAHTVVWFAVALCATAITKPVSTAMVPLKFVNVVPVSPN